MSIAIVTPSYNQGLFIERTLNSVLSQSIPNLQYVVMDGGSTDDTLAILNKYKKHIRFISESDRGQAHAVNKAIMMTQSDIIGWLNSDDVYFPKTLPVILAYFNAHPDVEILYGKAHHIDEKERVIEPYPTEPWNLSRLRQTCYLSQPAVFFRRNVILKYGLLNEQLHYCLDYEYWLRLALRGARFAYLEEVLAGSRLHPSTKTCSAPEKALLETMTMLKDRLGYVPTGWLLQNAISTVKQNTDFRKPELRFLMATYAASAKAAFKWNGLIRGLGSCVSLPKRMFDLAKK